MTRALPRPLAMDWRIWALAFVLVIPNALILFSSLQYMARWEGVVYDWWLIEEASARIGTGTMYEWGLTTATGEEYLYRYSPLLPYAMAPFLVFGLDVWRVLHAAALVLLPTPVAGLALISGPFWMDVANGNFLTFAVVAAWLAVLGHRWAMAAYFVLALLIPRPLMLPVMAWLLWKQPASRPILVGVLAVMVPLTFVTGEAFAWVAALTRGGDLIGTAFDWGPSRFLGAWWLLVGIPLGVWLTWQGRLGLASLAVSPYLIGYYLLMLLLELAPDQRITRARMS